MKKLMMAAAIVCAAAYAQAASIIWSAYSYSGGEIADSGYFVDSKGEAYGTNPTGVDIVLAKVTGYGTEAMVATVLNVGMNDGTGIVSGTYEWEYVAATSPVKNGDVVAVLARIDDGEGNYTYKTLEAADYAPGGTSAGYDAGTINTMTVSGLSDDSYYKEFEFASSSYAVPEPTSGLLLLLGMAGLALRRRRA